MNQKKRKNNNKEIEKCAPLTKIEQKDTKKEKNKTKQNLEQNKKCTYEIDVCVGQRVIN